jgi:nicotinamidase-related amidase
MTHVDRDWRQFALLLIDLQQDFWPTAMAQQFPDLPNNITKLLGFCRLEGISVVHLRACFQPDMSDWMVPFKLRGRTPCIAGTPGVEVLPFAREMPDETVILKQTFDGFHNPQLMRHLQRNGIRFVLVAGLVTATCVLFTATSAAQLGFLTAVIEDCCASEPAVHEHILHHYRFAFERTTVDQIPERHTDWLNNLKRLDTMILTSKV